VAREVRILKFGGSSLATPERVRNVARIIQDRSHTGRTVVVVSAFAQVTNQLLECARKAESGDPAYEQLYRHLAKRHRHALDVLVGARARRTRAQLDAFLQELREALHGISLLRHSPPRAQDLTASFGERLSALILAAHLNRTHPAMYVDARGFMRTDDQFTSANIEFNSTNENIRKTFAGLFRAGGRSSIPVVTGFIAATEDGITTTIGRNGSDYTAAILGAALGATVIEIWTDVDGVLSADPRAVSSAFVLPQMSYEEAMELSYFGAKVLHSASIAPAVADRIPILIKNTMNPNAPGTLISRSGGIWEGVAKGITSVDEITLITLRGLSMVGVPGTAERLFRALADERVNVILISQASSEHTICFAVKSSDAARARKAIAQEFRYELHHHLTALDERQQQTILAIVGEGMRGTPGVAGSIFQALGRNSINISAIAQGASERNISVVINSSQKNRSLNVIHQAFFEKQKKLGLVVIGVGNIGTALLEQLHQQRQFLRSHGFDVSVCGLANTKGYVFNTNGIDLQNWRIFLEGEQRRMEKEEVVRRLADLELPNGAIVDCTASADIVAAYPAFVRANMHIITPNKVANVLDWKHYESLMQLMRLRQKHFLYEANVGAGLPIISTLKDLIASGDTIIQIEGILSGTLSYLFNTFDGTTPFSELVQQARRLGFTEPDPREDLSGQDVARKLLILARQLGARLDLRDIQVESLVPPRLRRGTLPADFFRQLSRSDNALRRRLDDARSRKRVLRFVGVLRDGKATAGLKSFPLDHPFAGAKGSDNIITFTTKRYARTPLVVQGPGAGADVTAMGVFSDILKLLHYLPY